MPERILPVNARRRNLISAVAGLVLPIVVVTLGFAGRPPTTFLVGGGMAAAGPIATILAPERWWVLRLSLGLASVAGLTLLQANTGGVSSPFAALLVMAMVGFGLMASDGELVAGVVLTVGCCFLPMLAVGPPAYPVHVPNALALALVNCTVMLGLAAATRDSWRLTSRLRHESTHDRLTGLLNRRGWDELVDHELGDEAATGRTAVFGLVDLDHLKDVNDTLGHDRGDRLLSVTGERLRAAFPGNTTLARLGGDEFAVLCVPGRLDDVVDALDRARCEGTGEERFSAGVAQVACGETSSDAMRRADLALYEAKQTGRNRTCVASGPVPETWKPLPVNLG